MKDWPPTDEQARSLPVEGREGAESAAEMPFLARWSQRKRASTQEPDAPAAEADPVVGAEEQEHVPAPVTTTELPPLESLDEDSDYRVFLAPEVSLELRRGALRKLFHTARFQERCPLNEYSEDFHAFTPLSDTVTYDMRRGLERVLEAAQDEARRDLPPGAVAQSATDNAGAPPLDVTEKHEADRSESSNAEGEA